VVLVAEDSSLFDRPTVPMKPSTSEKRHLLPLSRTCTRTTSRAPYMVGLLGVFLDISLHKLANESLVESQEKSVVLSTFTPTTESFLGRMWSGQR